MSTIGPERQIYHIEGLHISQDAVDNFVKNDSLHLRIKDGHVITKKEGVV